MTVELSHHSGSVLDLIPRHWSKMYLHQLEGFDFMWKKPTGSSDLKELSNPEPMDIGGCIIPHAPGTGKVSFSILFMHTPWTLPQFPPCGYCSCKLASHLGRRVQVVEQEVGHQHFIPQLELSGVLRGGKSSFENSGGK
ncbi:hypothetical protein BT93_L3584 [Corymbia citriodora subsp. variegata]|uniref:Uncharacterized protein n=1 Tax=Corymbia citriodora subsp. variegata TaxID=360336 RepID=A0A8T0CVE2_CORYI|nr:hypothetical protein BT93_L3584 [Corymbia citriodora subsp. variegata]